MKISLFWCIFTIYSLQDLTTVESVPISAAIHQKLQSIAKWLDTLKDASIFDYIFRVNKGLGLNLFEGDIYGYHPKHRLRTAITNRQQIWNTRVVPYIIDSSFSSAERKDIEAAFDEYHQKTCIRWVPRSSEKDYVHFKQISGCYSNIGRTGGEQDISLMGPCLKRGTAVHEMMHALGFWHEQSRPDRDTWVHVIQSNIQDGKEYNFEKLAPSEVDTLGVKYDYGSVMHYSKYAFSKNGNPTIMPTHPPTAEIGQRSGLSDFDIQRIKILYGCDLPSKNQQTTKKPAETKPPVTKPPVTQPPPTNPPTTQAPVTTKPTTQAPVTTRPTTQAPVTTKPTTQAPVTTKPTTQAPVTTKPTTQAPVTTKPTTQAPVTTKSTTQAPVTTKPTQPPQTNPPVTQPPQTNPPVTQPPQTNPPVTQPPQTNPPVTQPPQTNPTVTQPPQTTVQVVQPINYGGWSEWSYWSPCDLQCLHSRYRICESYDWSHCPGENNQVDSCPGPCKPASSFGCWYTDGATLLIPSAEGMAADLTGPYTNRSESIRKCGNYAALIGYTIFAVFNGGQCLTGPNAAGQFALMGPSDRCDYRGVGSHNAISVYTFERDIDGQWSPWSKWGRCTTTCGIGRQYRYRRCDNPPPIGNGVPCVGDDMEEAICNLGTCISPVKCGTRFHAGGPGSSGLIWLRDYDNFMECEYEIATGDIFGSISVYIHEINVEYSKGCIYDSLMLFDGHNGEAPMVGSFCGSDAPGTFESSSNRLYLKFVSDETNTDRGFTVFYAINSRSRKACSKPPPAAHTIMTLEGNLVGDRASFRCEPGYRLVGHSPITCVDQPGFALWDEKIPRCVTVQTRRSVSNGIESVCTFEDSLCGFKNLDNSEIKWTVKRPWFTGNLTNSNQSYERGNYLFAESNRLQSPGDIGRISSSVYSSITPNACLKFLYKVDGSELASFSVHVLKIDDIGGLNGTEEALIFEETGSNENVWNEMAIDLQTTFKFQIVFQAALGEEIGSSVSLDNIHIGNGRCTIA